MTLRFPLLAACLTLASLGGLARTTQAPVPGLRAVVARETAYLLGDAEQVAGPGVTWASAAPGGRYLLCERRRPLSNAPTVEPESALCEVSLIAWDSKTRKASTLWRREEWEGARISMVPFDWVGASTAIVLEKHPSVDAEGKPITEQTVFLVNVRGGVQSIALSPQLMLAIPKVHPRLPLVAINQVDMYGTGRLIVKLIRGSGSPTTITLTRPGLSPLAWSDDGKRLYFIETTTDEKKALKTHWLAMDMSETLTDLPQAPTDLAISVKTPESDILKITEKSSQLSTGTKNEALASLWISDAKASELSLRIAADINPKSALLLPDLSAVAYRQNGALFAAPLTALDKVAFEELLTRAKRKKTLADAKQVGIALMMYVQDYDAMLPPSGGYLAGAVDPYLRGADLLRGFKFTYAGSRNIADIGKPNETVLGHINGPGGRAVVFADGHVRWEDE